MYKEILNNYISDYVREFGQRKFKKICDKITQSSKLSGFNNVTIQKGHAPNHMDIYYVVNGVPYFMICKAETLCIGCLLALDRWNLEANENYIYMDEFQLSVVAQKVIKQALKTKVRI